MRKFHRWVMTVFVLLLTYWAGSGLVLAFWDLTDKSQAWADSGGGPGARTHTRETASPLDPKLLDSMIAKTLSVARSESPNTPLLSVTLKQTDDGLQGLAEFGGKTPHQLTVELPAGTVLSSLPVVTHFGTEPVVPQNSMHDRIKNWHRGNFVGDWGISLAVLNGIALTTLGITGVIVYFTMWNRRRRSGRAAFFWK